MSIESDIDINLLEDENGYTAFMLAVEENHTDIANYLMWAGAGGIRGWFYRHLSIWCY